MSSRFLEIKRKYVSTFAQKQLDLKSAWVDRDIPLLKGLLHKLAGSSGSYGFDDINMLCHQAMDPLDKYDEKQEDLVDVYLKEIMILLEESES